jgi:SAM-dependent methyltransferase
LNAKNRQAPPAGGQQQGDAVAALLPLLSCPSCRHDDGFAARAEQLVCAHCRTVFPLYKSGAARVPWLFREPEAVRLEWRARYNAFLHASAAEQARLEKAATEVRRGPAAARIGQLGRARDAQRKQIVDVLGPLKLGAARAEPTLDRTGTLHGALPKRAALARDYDLLFRDWAWENGESQRVAECVRRVLAKRPAFRAGKLLTLGAGAGRLSYDLHRHHGPEISVALDWNPLLVLVGAKAALGEPVMLHEFPAAPLDRASFAVARTCVAPEPLTASGANFSFVLGDALDAPFKPASFDTVLTPWLVDAVPQSFTDCVRSVNRLLKERGTWVNTGTLAFTHRDAKWCVSQEEALDAVAANGFDVVASEREAVPYLQSPASAHGRIERVLTFMAVKTADCEAPERRDYLPAWLADGDRPVPDLDEFVVASAQRLLHAQILAAVDGRRSVEEIAQLVAKRYQLQLEEARGAVTRVLHDLYESAAADRPDPARTLE